jgi:hypothetical protein
VKTNRGLSIKRMAELGRISRSGFYRFQKPEQGRLPKGGRMSLERSNSWYKGPPRTRENSSLCLASTARPSVSTVGSAVPIPCGVWRTPFIVLRATPSLPGPYSLALSGWTRATQRGTSFQGFPTDSLMPCPGGVAHYFLSSSTKALPQFAVLDPDQAILLP